MRIYDEDSKRSLTSVCLYLTPAEARRLARYAEELATDPSGHHSHINDSSSKREITIAVYTKENLSQFDAESKKLLSDAFSDEG